MNAPVESVPVIQADREAAASHLEGWRWYESVGPRVVNEIRQGKRDDSETVQNFARHRTNQVAELVEALERIYTYANDTLSGRVDGPDDRKWQRDCVAHVRNIAREFAHPSLHAEMLASRQLIDSHKGEQP